jgi:hypothetical protein
MRIFKYRDYDHYLEAQERTNKEKLNWVYVSKNIIDQISKDKKTANNILCHGTRNGAEQKYFKELFPNAYVIGTEISSTAKDFPMTIQHDFTKVKEEWIGKFDIIYSNSFDHSIDPKETINVWANQLSDEGRLYLEYSEKQSIGNDADPLDATAAEIENIIKEKLNVIGKITNGVKHSGVIFICERKNND